MTHAYSDSILRSRSELPSAAGPLRRAEEAAEGGCGVLGFTSKEPVSGKHVLTASRQMHNRGNGKGGGIAMVGLDPRQARVEQNTLDSHYLLQIALLDPLARQEVEAQFIEPYFQIAQAYELPHLEDYRQVAGLEVCPPQVWRYFVRARAEVLDEFAERSGLQALPERALEDEFVYQNSFRLNEQFYASLGAKRAFVLSHGRNLSVLKIVGYAEDVVEYYQLEDATAHVWIAHQRYPTKGRVWHPGGAHPFIGLNEALVHNGDFANYHAVAEYLRQRQIGQQFLTDTEVSVQLFDLWNRVYGYPLEVTLEAMAPTSEHDFLMLPEDKQCLYHAVQRTHLHASPDGPWFFIVARSLPDQGSFELLGITDTSMLRPQVFALYENGEGAEKVQIGLIASERQAIHACLRSLAAEDERYQASADHYWAARGGSHTDGGAFRFTLSASQGLQCADKFGKPVRLSESQEHVRRSTLDPQRTPPGLRQELETYSLKAFDNGGASSYWRWLKAKMPVLSWDELAWELKRLVEFSCQSSEERTYTINTLHSLRDRRYPSGSKKRASILGLVDQALVDLFDRVPEIGSARPGEFARLTWEARLRLCPPTGKTPVLVLDALRFPPEGEQSAARWMARAYEMGWRKMHIYNWRGGRFAACGFGPDSSGTRIDLYGDVGDYAASGLDGAEVHIHGDGQDQLGQILKKGRLVIHGDAGQTFLYGAKGGEIYVLGSAAGRPLINAVGQPRAVINGTCLDYLAESFMAGDPHQGGGFVILNGVRFDEYGRLCELETPYPGGNLFSLASGGAIFVRDPHQRLVDDQLNGGYFARLEQDDWDLIEPYLRENERLFEIQVEDLLTVDGVRREPWHVYRKVRVGKAGVLNG